MTIFLVHSFSHNLRDYNANLSDKLGSFVRSFSNELKRIYRRPTSTLFCLHQICLHFQLELSTNRYIYSRAELQLLPTATRLASHDTLV